MSQNNQCDGCGMPISWSRFLCNTCWRDLRPRSDDDVEKVVILGEDR
jgi:hypothetical protein